MEPIKTISEWAEERRAAAAREDDEQQQRQNELNKMGQNIRDYYNETSQPLSFQPSPPNAINLYYGDNMFVIRSDDCRVFAVTLMHVRSNNIIDSKGPIAVDEVYTFIDSYL